jgi:hypothetical protein
MNTIESLLTDFLTQRQAAAELGICGRTLDRWHSLGEGPPLTKLGRRVLYRRTSLQIWLLSREKNQKLAAKAAYQCHSSA